MLSLKKAFLKKYLLKKNLFRFFFFSFGIHFGAVLFRLLTTVTCTERGSLPFPTSMYSLFAMTVIDFTILNLLWKHWSQDIINKRLDCFSCWLINKPTQLTNGRMVDDIKKFQFLWLSVFKIAVLCFCRCCCLFYHLHHPSHERASTA